MYPSISLLAGSNIHVCVCVREGCHVTNRLPTMFVHSSKLEAIFKPVPVACGRSDGRGQKNKARECL